MTFALMSKSKTKQATSRKPTVKPKLLPIQRAVKSSPVLGVGSFPAPTIQTKLKIGEPNDKFEQEADRVADEVMRMPEPDPVNQMELAKPSSGQGIQRFCPECKEELYRQLIVGAKMEEQETLQTKGNIGHTPTEVTSGLESRIQSLKGRGEPMPKSVRSFFEPRFGVNFSGVRVHADRQAAQLTQAINARAFTVGRDVAFEGGQYAPNSIEGRQLLAHELVHAIQQSGSENGQQYCPNTLQISTPSLSHLNENSNFPMIQRQKRMRKKAAGKQLIIIANGYPGYRSDKKEVEASQKGLWFPNTPDFSATASDTQKRFSGARTADEFFGALQSEKNRIKRVAFIGHGNPSGLGLSGKPMSFFEKGLTKSDITRWQQSINKDIKPKLSKDTTLDLFACNTAIGGGFMKALAQSLGVCVRGFTGQVFWCLGFNKVHTITSRGRIADSRVKTDCSGKGWFKGVNKLTPPSKICP